MKRFAVLALVLAGAGAGAVTTAGGAATPSLTVRPSTVHVGGTVTIVGLNWGNHKKVTLRVGRPGSSATIFLARPETNNIGKFKGYLPVKKGATPGTYTIIACRSSCAIKRTKTVHIVP